MTTAPLRTGSHEYRRHANRWLRDLLRTEVIGGRFHGGVLPTEAELMLTYAVSRATVRKALELLRAEGLVERVQGTGTFAVDQRTAAKMVELHGVDLRRHGLSSRLLARQVVPMPRVVARRLGATPSEDCLLYEYVGYVYGEPLGVYTNYLRFPEAEAVREADLETHWYAMLTDAGLGVGDSDLTIEVLRADEALADVVPIEPGRPILGMEQVIRDASGRPYDFAILRSRADRLSLMSRAVCARVAISEVTT